MNTSPSFRLGLLAAVCLFPGTPAFAVLTIDYVSVGNPGNAPDTNGYGSVPFEYLIGKYEVTNTEYAAFLNAKAKTDPYNLYNPNMASYGIMRSGSSGSFVYVALSGFEDKPVVYVSWFDAARFTNWLGNGQGNGDTETGAYTLNGATSGIITVNSGAGVYLPSEDEWYKAAYYDGVSSTYSLFPTQTNTITTAMANYAGTGSQDVGSYAQASFYGTFDQGGNVCEWNDAVISGNLRGQRAGSWTSASSSDLISTSRYGDDPANEHNDIGFRVVSVVPEPSALLLAMLSTTGCMVRRRR